jgi:hypothetical protein
MIVTDKSIESALDGLFNRYVTDYKLAEKMNARHLQDGVIPLNQSKEGDGVEVYGFGNDELGNVVAICKDGQIRQFFY